MEMSGFVSRYGRKCLKLAPLLVLALMWLWFLIAVFIIGSSQGAMDALSWWDAMV